MGQMFSSESFYCNIDSIASIDETINKVLFQPPNTDPYSIYALHNGKDVILTSAKDNYGHSISIIKFYPNINPRKYIIFSHGNGCDIYTMSEYFKFLCNSFDVCVLSYDYNGYGLSGGLPTEENCYNCLGIVVKYVKNDLNVSEDKIVLIGQSLGTGITIHYACKYNWKSPIILISPYKSIPRVMCDSSLADCCIGNYKFKSTNKIKDLTCPIKIFHGELDQVIDISHGKYLYKMLINKQLQPVWIKHADHDNILSKIENRDLDEVFSLEMVR